MPSPEPQTFYESSNLLLVRPGDRDALASDELHSLKQLIEDYRDAYKHLDSEGLFDPRSSLGNGGDALAGLSDDEELALFLADCAPERSSLLTRSAGVEHLPPAA